MSHFLSMWPVIDQMSGKNSNFIIVNSMQRNTVPSSFHYKHYKLLLSWQILGLHNTACFEVIQCLHDA